MSSALLQILSLQGRLMDAGLAGAAITLVGSATVSEDTCRFSGGYLRVGTTPSFNTVDVLTLDLTFRRDPGSASAATLFDGQQLPLRLELDTRDVLTARVRTGTLWQSIGSSTTLARGVDHTVRVVRASDDQTSLWVDGRLVVTKRISGTLTSATSPYAATIGASAAGTAAFRGTVRGLVLYPSSAVPDPSQWTAEAARMEALARNSGASTGLQVVLNPDEVAARLLPIKEILAACAVNDLQALSNLQIAGRRTLSAGSTTVAAAAPPPATNWRSAASSYPVQGSEDARRESLATWLPNRNSTPWLVRQAPGRATTPPIIRTQPTVGMPLGRTTGVLGATNTGRVSGPEIGRGVTGAVTAGSLALRSDTGFMPLVQRVEGKLIADMDRVANLQVAPVRSQPPLAPPPPPPAPVKKSIPVNSAVMIAKELDLTNSELVIEPDVTTFYLIADRLICGTGARITWRRPGGSTRDQADDDDLNGKDYYGIHTSSSSRDGYDGGDGRDGAQGLNGAAGRPAPHVEIWVRDLEGMPSIDLHGEDGRDGGRGQDGGHGGDGADGELGKNIIFCVKRAGNGGDGGDGGDGGRGGAGGDGGHGGDITIGVLTGTLEAAIAGHSARLSNDGGAFGRGGQGGGPGEGGDGGEAGIRGLCKAGQDGQDGQRGRSGSPGANGTRAGEPGLVLWTVFTEDQWRELNARPWLEDLEPSAAFPGSTIILRSSTIDATSQVLIAGDVIPHRVVEAGMATIVVPPLQTGGEHPVWIRRSDGTESNHLTLRVRPQLVNPPTTLSTDATVRLSGRAFVDGATVGLDDIWQPAREVTTTSLTFTVTEREVTSVARGQRTLLVRNPDGLMSDPVIVNVPRAVGLPFEHATHGFSFYNPTTGSPSWKTFEETFGKAEVIAEMIFHPATTAGFYAFYHHYLLGDAADNTNGTATGFCTAMSALVADRFWTRQAGTAQLQLDAELRERLTAVHGRILSRQVLLKLHEQTAEGQSRIEKTLRQIERRFLDGTTRETAPLLFFVPAGTVWKKGYVDGLASSHCVMPWRLEYPPEHPGVQRAADGTVTSPLDGVKLYIWDCNHVEDRNTHLAFTRDNGILKHTYAGNHSLNAGNDLTLAMLTLDEYLLQDVSLPTAGGLLGALAFLTEIVSDGVSFTLEDETGARSGAAPAQNTQGIAGVVPAHFVPGMWLSPPEKSLTRRLTGTGSGQYSWKAWYPSGLHIALEGVPTAAGQMDMIEVNADGSQLRITPGATKTFTLRLGKQLVGEQRQLHIRGLGGGPGAPIDITIAPDLSFVRVGNRGLRRSMVVEGSRMTPTSATPTLTRSRDVGVDHDMVIIAPDPDDLVMDALPFE